MASGSATRSLAGRVATRSGGPRGAPPGARPEHPVDHQEDQTRSEEQRNCELGDAQEHPIDDPLGARPRRVDRPAAHGVDPVERHVPLGLEERERLRPLRVDLGEDGHAFGPNRVERRGPLPGDEARERRRQRTEALGCPREPPDVSGGLLGYCWLVGAMVVVLEIRVFVCA